MAFVSLLLCFHSGCLPGWAWGKSTCHTGVGRTCPPSPTAACAGCLASPVTLVSVPTWRSLRCRDLGPIHALPQPMASSVKKLPVRDAHACIYYMNVLTVRHYSVIWKKLIILSFPVQETPIRVPVRPVRSLARCTTTVPTVLARPWSVCGAAVRSAVSTRPHMSSLFPMASVWSGKLQIAWVSVFYWT